MPAGNPGTLQYYLTSLTSEYVAQPNFIATITALTNPFAQTINLTENLYTYFNLNTAVGDQLTKLGNWAGVSRNIQQPLSGVYFSLDSNTLGLDQGSMQGEFDPSSGLVSLPDDSYRQIVQMNITINKSNGTKIELYNAISPLLTPAQLIIQGDNNNNVFYGLLGTPNNSLFWQLFQQGYFSFTSAGVGVTGNVIHFNAINLNQGLNLNTDSTFSYFLLSTGITGTFTLNANATSTIVSVPGAASGNVVIWSANTEDSASAIPFMSGVCGTNQIVFTHASNSNID